MADKSRVRLIGIDTPELKTRTSPQQCFSQEAQKITQGLIENQTVELEKDISETDKYGRLLRYIYIEDVFVNDFLLRWGFAKLDLIPPDLKYGREFKDAEKEAKENRRGLWKSC